MSVRILTVRESILGVNEKKAKATRDLLDKRGILMLNIMASPGAGKTSLILQTINGLKGKTRIAVIEGDIASSIDAEKINRVGVTAIQINTGGGCHLDANMVAEALGNLPIDELDLLFVENVGNLVCPAEFDLGEHKKVVLLSVPEGDDKPYKYPVMFTEADVVVVSKSDVLPHFDFNIAAFSEGVKGLKPDARIFVLSARTGEGMAAWLSWIEGEIKRSKKD